MKKKKDDFVDDGRVIAPMDVDGMPFSDRRPLFRQKDRKIDPNEPQFSAKERRQVALSAMLAGAVLSLIFIAAAALFIWLLTVIF